MTVADARRRLFADRLRRVGLARSEEERTGPGVDRDHALPSFAQLHAWRHQQQVPGSVANNLGVRFTLRGDLDERALATALDTLSARHEVLRTTFHSGTEPWVRVHDALPVPVERLAVSDPDEVPGLLARRTAVPFDLAVGPPWRIVLVRSRPYEWELLLVVQHLLWDGPTFAVFCSDLGTAYRAALTGAEPDGEPPGRSLVEIAAEERAGWRGRPTADEDRRYWTDRLTPAPALGGEPVGERGARTDRRLGAVTPERLRAAARAAGVTPFAVAISCWAQVWGAHTGTDDVAVGTLAVRRGPEEAALMGNFANPVTLRLDLSDGADAATRLRRAADECAAALAHADLPFLPLAEELAGHDGTGSVPFFDSIVVFLAGDLEGPRLPGLAVDWARVDHGGVQFPLVPVGVEIFVRAAGIDVQLTRDRDRVTGEQAGRLLDRLDDALRDTVEALVEQTS
ncbi:condensation domain-containing protein [Pseudonocardia sp. HH130630-07]|uniref:condensation domain-containing protein n=1 Tax=Pseudonocardia sp. HH130630-07 TaxID=1690815 RepID=UPI000814ED26|nr:condensation domain-containing protein [Pseudonocardia sp. HH130630-07]ANY07725.1 hypothetical protein AFB00_17100 [Pseudonocardia sp. HH130630-07]